MRSSVENVGKIIYSKLLLFILHCGRTTLWVSCTSFAASAERELASICTQL
jgi:hypothetical protein